jgi:hypothetical protein
VLVDVVEDVRENEGDLGKIKNRIIGSGEEQLDQIMFNPRNWRIHPLSQQDALKGVLEEVGWVQQVIVNKRTGNLIDGHLRCQLAAREGAQTIPVVYVDVSEDEESLVLATLDPIGAMAATDKQKLDELFAGIESENENVRKMMDEIAAKERLEYGEKNNVEQARRTLAERFIVPPFSVLDARQGYWQERKRAWIDLGIRSEVGRKENAIGYGDLVSLGKQDTSIFDPVLCEIAYRWFAPAGGNIVDPFAGGSVRGVVASKLGHHYTGIDLSKKQIEANNKQSDELLNDNKPEWIVGNSLNVKSLAPGEYDFIFSCPPYYDLEVYSDEEGELSTLGTYEEFIAIYRQIIADCVSMLKDDRFACFVVGDIRDNKGFYRNFPADTISAFQDAGMTLYNEAILVTMVGTASLRTSHQFPIGRKLGKTHQNVLVFYKGDVADIKTWGDVERGVPDKSEHIEQL